jgi:hypothetical protein
LSGSSGEAFAFDSEIQAGQDYGVEVDDGGSGSYTLGYAGGAKSYPVTGTDIDIVGQSGDGTQTTNNAYQGVTDFGNPDGVLE